MKSICIKTNNLDNLNYLLNLFDHLNQENVYFSTHCFKHYKNIIIHYTGNTLDVFISKICELLIYLVIEKYEENILKRLIFTNYFYFNPTERDVIFDICIELFEEDISSFEQRYNLLYKNFYNYLLDNKKIILDGFINFRQKDYVSFLGSIVDTAVNKFIVEREYLEFISLLRIYINSEAPNSEIVHLIYGNNQAILLDEGKNVISLDKDAFKAKYLSDISFSANDYALNTLLNILPKKIFVHLVEKRADDFVNTLQLVFEDRVSICNNCPICNNYKKHFFKNIVR